MNRSFPGWPDFEQDRELRWPTTWRMIVPVAAVSMLLLIVGGTAAWYVHQLNREVSQRLSHNVSAVLASERLVFELRDVRLDLDQFADTSDPTHLDSAIGARREIERSLGEVEATSAEQQSIQLREHTCHVVRRFLDRLGDIAGQPTERTTVGDARRLIAELSDVLAPAEQLLTDREHAAAATSRRNETIADRVGLGLLLLGICGAVAGLLTGYGIARGVHRSIVQLSLPVHDMAGKLNEVVGPITVESDIDLNVLEEALQTLAEKTSEAVKRIHTSQHQQLRNEQLAAVGQLAAGLAHELRNPLMSIKLLIQSAAERDGKESLSRRDLQVLEDEIVRLERMVQSFLDFARPPRLQKEPLELAALIERVVEVIQPRAGQQDVQLHYDWPDEVLTIEGDESQLRQVLLNLLLNALDALPNGGNIWLRVRQNSNLTCAARGTQAMVKLPDGDGEIKKPPHIYISVADDGPGIMPDVADRIFEPFVSTKETGTGLGLSICRQVLESHGGTISANNRAEGGAEFTISLPVEESPDHVPASSQPNIAMQFD